MFVYRLTFIKVYKIRSFLVCMEKRAQQIFIAFKECLLIICAIILVAFGLKSFLIPNGVIDGGVTGLSLLISFLSPISVSLALFVLNIPFMFMARKQMGNIFAMKTFLVIIGLSIALIFFDFPIITTDKLLAVVFGGFMVGAGTGLAIRGGSVTDGIEVLSIYLNKKFGLSIGEVVFGLNAIIFSVAAILLSVESALYSILTYLAASKTIDFFVQGIEEYIGLTVISKKSEDIRKMLINEAGKGVTIFVGKNGYQENKTKQKNIDILYTFVTRLEVVKIKQKILLTDSNAVIIEQGIHEIHGGIVKKRPLHS